MVFFCRITWLKFLDATVGSFVCKLMGLIRYWLRKPSRTGDANIRSVRRILLIRPGGLGDMLMLLPALKAIRRNNWAVSLDVICESRNVDILKLAGMDVVTHEYDVHPVRLLRTLAHDRFDVIIDSEQFHNFSALFAILTGSPVRIGFSNNPVRLSLYTHLVRYDVAGFEANQFAQLLAPLGLKETVTTLDGILLDVPLFLPPAVETAISTITQGKLYVALCPGSSNSAKFWSLENFTALMLGLWNRGLVTVLVGGRSDVRQCEQLRCAAEKQGVPSVSFAGKLSLEQSAAILRQAALFVGCDSGLSHLAVCLGTPSVTLFGPSDPAKWAAEDGLHRIVYEALSCAPCSFFGYNKLCREIECMSSIQPKNVLITCDQVLKYTARNFVVSGVQQDG